MSIDVGIKNLSFIIFDAKYCDVRKRNIYEIKTDTSGNLLWDTLDITPEAYHFNCNYTSKNKKTACNKLASHVQNEKYFCNAHKKFIDTNLPFYSIDRNKISVDEIFKTLVIKLDKLFIENPSLGIKQIIIEKQPPTNPRMKSIMSVLQSYFIIRGIVDKIGGISLVDKIHLLDAKHKLSVYDGPPINVSHLKKKYDQRKFLSKEYTKYILENYDYDIYFKYFEQFPTKKDDLADCFLQAYYYYEKVLGKKEIMHNNMIQKYKDISVGKIKKSSQYSEKKLKTAKTINLMTLKFIIDKYQINQSNIHLSPYKKLIEKCCYKYFGNTQSLWSITQ